MNNRKDAVIIFRTTKDRLARDTRNAQQLGCTLSEYYRTIGDNVRFEPVATLEPLRTNSNASANVLPDRAGIAR